MSELEVNFSIGITEEPPIKRQKINEPVAISDNEEESEEDDEFIECMICSSNWKPSGKHRLVSLKCGHLFGRSCIERWIEDRIRKLGQNKGQCPICLEVARIKEVRIVKHTKITAEDNAITNKLKEEINQLKIKMERNTHTLDHAQLALNLCKRELKRAREVKDNNNNNNTDILKNDPTVVSQQKTTTTTTMEKKPFFKLLKTIQSSDRRDTYRVMEVCIDYEAVVLSYQPKDNNALHGIRKISLLDMEHPEYIPLHSKNIRDIKSSPHQPDLVISTGLDKTLVLTSLKSNTKLHTYPLSTPAWSCHVDFKDPNILYCGLTNSNIMVFDIRNSKTHVKSLSTTSTTSPLHSIQSIRVNDKNTLLCSNLRHTFLWQDPTDENPTCTILDVNNNNDYHPFSVSTTNNDTFLVSSRHKNATQHKVIKIANDHSIQTQFTFESPFPQISLCKTWAFQDNDVGIVCCYAEEEKKSLCLRNATDEIQRFTLNRSLLDVKTYQNQLLLALTDNQLYTFKT